jgi:8-oxo-dGTP pyrophosphatase MutT (NUDIX family)
MTDRSQKSSVNGAFCGVIREKATFGSAGRFRRTVPEVFMVRHEKGYYELPGGGIEDELPQTTAMRETDEEAGIVISSPRLLMFVGTGVQLVPSPWITEKIDIFSNLVMLYRVKVNNDVAIRTTDVENTGTMWMGEAEILRRARAKGEVGPDTIPIVQARMALRTLYPSRWSKEFFLRDPLYLGRGREL